MTYLAHAPQPGLRSFIVYDAIPAGCSPQEVREKGIEPHARRGEIVVVDDADRQPMHGELFAIEWSSSGNRDVVEIRRWKDDDCDGNPLWIAQWMQTVHRLDGSVAYTHPWMDGPYPEWAIQEKLIGRVIGIYQP